MATQLGIYNKALGFLGERKLVSLSENREPRRVLDDWWDLNAFLEMGLWRFSKRTSELVYDPSIEPSFGFSRAFPQPDDFVRTIAVAADSYFKLPLRLYSVEAGVWFCDLDVLYVSYVSNDPQYGADLGSWPSSFENWVASYLAKMSAMRITGNNEKKFLEAERLESKMLTLARSRDAMEDPTQTPPAGNWVQSRSGRWRSRVVDGGSRDNLIG